MVKGDDVFLLFFFAYTTNKDVYQFPTTSLSIRWSSKNWVLGICMHFCTSSNQQQVSSAGH
jgi:hypothetical protein